MADLYAKILPLHTETPGRIPDDATMAGLGKDPLENGEIALNLADRLIYSKRSDGQVVLLGGAGDSNVGSIGDLQDVDATLPGGRWTDFEPGQPGAGGGGQSSAYAKQGSFSWHNADLVLTGLMSKGDTRYICFSQWHYYTNNPTTNQAFLFSNKPSTSGNGFYIRIDYYGGIRVYGASGQYSIGGNVGTVPQNQWNHWYVQFDFGPSGSRNLTPKVSIWLNGALVMDQLVTPDLGSSTGADVYLEYLNNGFTYVDSINVLETAEPPALMGDTTVVPADIDFALRGDILNDGDTLLWSNASYSFVPGPPDIRYNLLDLDDYSGESRTPLTFRWQENALVGPGEFQYVGTTVEISELDATGYNASSLIARLPATGLIFYSSDGSSWASDSYSSLTYNSGNQKWVLNLSASPAIAPTLYLAFSTPSVTAERYPRNGELLQYDGNIWTPAPLTSSLAYGLDNLADVDTSSTPPVGGNALVWDQVSEAWIPGAAGVSGTITQLSDVDTFTTPPTDGQTLGWVAANSQWQPVDLVSRIQDATDYDGATPAIQGDTLVFDATAGKFKPTAGSSISTINDIADVDTASTPPGDGDSLVWSSNDNAWVPGGVQHRLSVRLDEIETTAAIADAANADIVFDGLGESGEFVQITVSEPSWVRFYPTAADRNADGSRTNDQDPQPGSGVLLEVLTTTSNETVLVTPGAAYYNNDTTTVPALYCRVTNLSGASSAISVTVRAYTQIDSTGYLPLASLKSEVAASTDFADFQARIAAL